MTTVCNCTDGTIDGYDIGLTPAWEVVLRNVAHGHYSMPGGPYIAEDAVREIDRLRAHEKSMAS